MGELLKKLWRDPAYFTSCVLGLAMFAGIYFAQPTGREWYERLALAASVAAGGGVAVAKASRSGPTGVPAVLLIVGLSAFASACQIPTSSRAQVGEKVASQGGSIACESGFTSSLSPDGTLTSVGCAGGITWTDPPTTEESAGLFGAIGDAITGLLSLPGRMIGGLAAGAQAGAPAP